MFLYVPVCSCVSLCVVNSVFSYTSCAMIPAPCLSPLWCSFCALCVCTRASCTHALTSHLMFLLHDCLQSATPVLIVPISLLLVLAVFIPVSLCADHIYSYIPALHSLLFTLLCALHSLLRPALFTPLCTLHSALHSVLSTPLCIPHPLLRRGFYALSILRAIHSGVLHVFCDASMYLL